MDFMMVYVALASLFGVAVVGVVGGLLGASLLTAPLTRRTAKLEAQAADLHRRLLELEASSASRAPSPAVAPTVSASTAATSPVVPAEASPTPLQPATTTSPTPVPLADSGDSLDGEGSFGPPLTPPPTTPTTPAEPTPEPAPAPVPVPARPVRPSKPFELPSIERLAVWIGTSLGALLLAVGALFGIVVAAEAGIFGPGLRVGFAMAMGTLAWVGGAAIGPRSPRAASALSAAGASTVFGAVWAATSLYALIPQAFGFALLTVVVAATMAQAGRFHDRVLGTMTVVGGLLASQVIRGDGAGPQLAYALILNTAVVALASTRRWPELLLWVGGGTALQLIGFATLHANPEHQAAALAGITLLTLPYAIVLARRGPADGLGMTALGVGALYVALAAPWTPALDEVFFDPRSGLIANTEGSSPLRAAAGALAVMVPLWLAARRSRSAIAAGVVTVAGVFPLLGFVSGWPAEELARSIVPVAMLGLGATIFVGDRASGRGLIPLLFLAPALLPLIEGAPATLTVGLGAVALITAIAGFTSTTGAASTIALASTAVAAAAIASHEDPPWALPALLVGLVGLHALPTLRTWPDEPTPWLPWVGALAAPTAFMPAGYLWWSDQLGDGVIGLLPLCSAAATLVIAAGLVLAGRITVESTVFAVAVLGILGGVTLALPMQLQTRWLTVGWALESSALAIMALRLRHPLLRWTSVLLALAVAARLLLNPWALAWGDASGWPILNWTLYTWGLPTICLLVTAGALRRGTPEGSPFLAFVPLLQVLAMLTGFALVNVQVSDAFQASGPLELAGRTMLQGMVRSLSWGAYGIGLLVVGLVLQSRMTRILGFAFILLGALKVCLYDLWSLPGLIRVGSLLGLGFFLMIAAFLFERLVLRERTTPKGE